MGTTAFATAYTVQPVVQTGTGFFQVPTWNMSSPPMGAVTTSTGDVFAQAPHTRDFSFAPSNVRARGFVGQLWRELAVSSPSMPFVQAAMARAGEQSPDARLFVGADFMIGGGAEYRPMSAADGDPPVAGTEPAEENTGSAATLSIDEIIERLKSKDASEGLADVALKALIDAYARRDRSKAVKALCNEITIAAGEVRINKPADWWVGHFLSSKDHKVVLDNTLSILVMLRKTQQRLVTEIFWEIAKQVDSDASIAEAFIELVRCSSWLVIDYGDNENDSRTAWDIIRLFSQSSSLRPHALMAIKNFARKLHVNQKWDLVQLFRQSESLRPYALQVAGTVGSELLTYLNSEEAAQLPSVYIRQLKLAERRTGGYINPPSIAHFWGGKYLVAIADDGDMEIRYTNDGSTFHHELALSGDKIVGAGMIKKTSDGRLAINGASKAIPTHEDYAEDYPVGEKESGNVSMAEESGLNVISRFLSELYGVEVEVKGD